MENRKMVVSREQMSFEEGKVIINSEELAAALQDVSVELETEEMAESSNGRCDTTIIVVS